MEIDNVWKVTQWGYGEGAGRVPLYVFSVPARVLVGEAEIFRRTPSRKKGYQRDLSPARLGTGKLGVAGYLLDQMGLFPTSVLVNVRKEDTTVKFAASSTNGGNVQVGKLSVPNNVKWYVIDGQHRLEGLKTAIREKKELEDYPVLLTMTNEELFHEMLMFYLVNSRARSVPTDLSYRILQRMLIDTKAPRWVEKVIMKGAERRKAISATIVDYLNTKEDSPFKGRIQEVGEPHREEHVTTDGTMTRYVSVIIGEKIFQNMYDDQVADLLASYWSAIRDLYPKAFNDAINYMLLKTLGLSSMSRLFPVVYGYCAKDKDLSKAGMKKYLQILLVRTPEHRDADFKDPIGESWWHAVDGPGIIRGTGEGHYTDVSNKFAEKIALVLKKKRI